MLFHSEFKMIPRRQGRSSGGVLTDTLSMLTTQPTQVALEGAMEFTYVYDNESIILEYQTDTITAKYTQGLNIDEPLALEKDNQTYYYHTDGLGSITALTNTSGSVVQTYSYDSFGNMTTTGNITQPFTYTAREYDQETGMYFYRARYYDSKVGRFVTKDPIGFRGGVNKYAYVKNNPINKKDPRGLDPFQDIWCDSGWCDTEPGMTRVEAEWKVIMDQSECVAKCVLNGVKREAGVEAVIKLLEGAAQQAGWLVAKGIFKKATWFSLAWGGIEGIECIVDCSCPNK